MKKAFVPLLTVLLSFLFLFSAYAAYPDTYMVGRPGPGASGWMQDGENWKYMASGFNVKGWAEIGDKWYWFDESGVMATGWKNVDGTDYYFTEVTVEGYPQGSCQNPYGETTQAAASAGTESQAAEAAEILVNPYGHTCVEVNLTGQFIRVWQGENLVVTGPCVTGYAGVHDTSVGDFTIKSKETDRYLQGLNDNGTKYKSYVNFWMPFNGGQGLHDAGWRGTTPENFGGNIYTWNGSHGCVNLPYDVAAALYNIAYVGMPVHVHN